MTKLQNESLPRPPLNLRPDRDSNGIMSRCFLPVAEWRSTNMAEWIEVPAHRIYVTCTRELRDGFDYIGENGKSV
jgi:hypothetical protein